MPIVTVSFMDANRQWFKARIGTSMTQAPRDKTFCAYTILDETDRVMVVPDALEDPRFKTNPIVVGYPYVRFYGGASITIDGHKIGTLCLLDCVPCATFTAKQEEVLVEIADSIADLMIYRRNMWLESRFNSVHMHQSILTILREPLHNLQTSALQLGQSVKAAQLVCAYAQSESKDEVHAALRRTEEHSLCFQQESSYFQKLLDTSLHALTRVAVNPETLDTMNAVDWTSRKHKLLGCNRPSQAKAQGGGKRDTVQLGMLLPFERGTWLQTVHELLDHFHWSQSSILIDIDNSGPILSHSDLLMLSVGSILGDLKSQTGNSKPVERIHTYYSALHNKLFIDIHSRFFKERLDVNAQSKKTSIFEAIRTMLSWVDGQLTLLSTDNETDRTATETCGIMRLEVYAEVYLPSPTTNHTIGAGSNHKELPPRHDKTTVNYLKNSGNVSSHLHQKEDERNAFITAFAHGFWQAMLSSRLRVEKRCHVFANNKVLPAEFVVPDLLNDATI